MFSSVATRVHERSGRDARAHEGSEQQHRQHQCDQRGREQPHVIVAESTEQGHGEKEAWEDSASLKAVIGAIGKFEAD
jgi:hypothetical protein